MKEIKEIIEQIEKKIIIPLRAEAISHKDGWKDNLEHRNLKKVDNEIKQLWIDLGEWEIKWGEKNSEVSGLKQDIIDLRKNLENLRIAKDGELTQLQQQVTSLQQQLATKPASSEISEESGMKKKAIQGSEPEGASDKLDLENYRGEWIQTINDVLIDKGNEKKDDYLKLTTYDLQGQEYVNFSKTLQEKKIKKEMDEFGREMIKHIAEKRQMYLDLVWVINEGKKAFESQNIEWAKKILICLEVKEKLIEGKVEAKNEEREQIFYNKIVEIYELRDNIDSLVQKAQVVQETSK